MCNEFCHIHWPTQYSRHIKSKHASLAEASATQSGSLRSMRQQLEENDVCGLRWELPLAQYLHKIKYNLPIDMHPLAEMDRLILCFPVVARPVLWKCSAFSEELPFVPCRVPFLDDSDRHAVSPSPHQIEPAFSQLKIPHRIALRILENLTFQQFYFWLVVALSSPPEFSAEYRTTKFCLCSDVQRMYACTCQAHIHTCNLNYISYLRRRACLCL